MKTRDEFGRFLKGVNRGPRSKKVKLAISKANGGSNNGMWNGGKPKCKICGIEIWWQSIYCSKHVERPWLKSPSLETRIKMSVATKKRFEKSENHPNWKGDMVGYISLHKWVERHKGIPIRCESCSFESNNRRKIQWANKSGKYKRDLNDFMALCVPCHRKYDYARIK